MAGAARGRRAAGWPFTKMAPTLTKVMGGTGAHAPPTVPILSPAGR